MGFLIYKNAVKIKIFSNFEELNLSRKDCLDLGDCTIAVQDVESTPPSWQNGNANQNQRRRPRSENMQMTLLEQTPLVDNDAQPTAPPIYTTLARNGSRTIYPMGETGGTLQRHGNASNSMY